MDGEAFVLAANMAGEAKIIGSVSFLLCKFFFFFFSFSTAFLSCKVAAAYGQGLVSDRKYGQHRIEWKMTPWIGNRTSPGGLWPVGAAVTDVINAL